MAAMMAHQPAEQAMLDQPGGAVRAFEPMAALPAKRQRRVAPAIEEQHGLLARHQRLRDRGDQRWRQEALSARPVVPEIDQLDRRQAR